MVLERVAAIIIWSATLQGPTIIPIDAGDHRDTFEDLHIIRKQVQV
jgi:hypothetical protein